MPAIQSSLTLVLHEDFTARPVISGWSASGRYWSSDRNFGQVGDRVEVSFTASDLDLAPFVAAGFGIMSGEIVPIRVVDISSV
ncbi:MAG: hypothetical protein HC841_06080 [Verrucomicrobiae bacterium]|nr:hypothetical protein [Verrucomicrobiae bacterium]